MLKQINKSAHEFLNTITTAGNVISNETFTCEFSKRSA